MRSRAIKRSREPLTQLSLDIGQKGVGTVECSVCGMVYQRSPQDVKVHEKYCRRSRKTAVSALDSKATADWLWNYVRSRGDLSRQNDFAHTALSNLCEQAQTILNLLLLHTGCGYLDAIEQSVGLTNHTNVVRVGVLASQSNCVAVIMFAVESKLVPVGLATQCSPREGESANETTPSKARCRPIHLVLIACWYSDSNLVTSEPPLKAQKSQPSIANFFSMNCTKNPLELVVARQPTEPTNFASILVDRVLSAVSYRSTVLISEIAYRRDLLRTGWLWEEIIRRCPSIFTTGVVLCVEGLYGVRFEPLPDIDDERE